jgi:hypothetical protein
MRGVLAAVASGRATTSSLGTLELRLPLPEWREVLKEEIRQQRHMDVPSVARWMRACDLFGLFVATPDGLVKVLPEGPAR